jgi:hypothetical protein
VLKALEYLAAFVLIATVVVLSSFLSIKEGYRFGELEGCKSSLAANPRTYPYAYRCVEKEDGKVYIINGINEVIWNVSDGEFE